ncbi:class I SAM-dependent methyltransferase [Megasphaera paucivorans]|uniref:O-methyltransferase n=1 Tax=Megasphaera paucivorans TaxID=349095 RepID=A0A1G9WE73_9FIRM|nr:TylF/MycF/NovP-related O-methyltransferase [Megasphaera paucivorans]SDM82798.1 O-methyltransferase [Megasphaera paucivorans]
MKTIVVLGAGQIGKTTAALINHTLFRILAFGDNAVSGHIYNIPIFSVEKALRLRPDIVVIAVRDTVRTKELKQQIQNLGFVGQIVSLSDFIDVMDMRSAVLFRAAERICNVEGSIAELGVYKGAFAAMLNELFPDRKLYLFDTFSGFDDRDIRTEAECGFSQADMHDFSDTNAAEVWERLPHKDNAKIFQGYFPSTCKNIQDVFALVSLDADLYEPTLAALEWFLPRMAAGGILIIHDWDSNRFKGIRKAVADYEKKHGRLALVPLGDFHGTAIVVKE